MAEYIERDKFRNILEAKAEIAMGTPKQVFYNTIAMLELIPAADVVEVVRCKDCKHRYDPARCALWYATMNGKEYFVERGEDFYCSYGERRKE